MPFRRAATPTPAARRRAAPSAPSPGRAADGLDLVELPIARLLRSRGSRFPPGDTTAAHATRASGDETRHPRRHLQRGPRPARARALADAPGPPTGGRLVRPGLPDRT